MALTLAAALPLTGCVSHPGDEAVLSADSGVLEHFDAPPHGHQLGAITTQDQIDLKDLSSQRGPSAGKLKGSVTLTVGVVYNFKSSSELGKHDLVRPAAYATAVLNGAAPRTKIRISQLEFDRANGEAPSGRRCRWGTGSTRASAMTPSVGGPEEVDLFSTGATVEIVSPDGTRGSYHLAASNVTLREMRTKEPAKLPADQATARRTPVPQASGLC